LTFGLWIETVAPCFIIQDNPVQNGWITVDSVNCVSSNEGQFLILILCEISHTHDAC